jgi:hypothetical protein
MSVATDAVDDAAVDEQLGLLVEDVDQEGSDD